MHSQPGRRHGGIGRARSGRARSRSAILLTVLALVLSTGAVALIATAQAAPVTVTVNAQADARVERSSPSTRYGSSTTLVADGSPVVESYLRFSVGAVTGRVTRAVLRLWTTNGSVDGPQLFQSATQWTESTVTWNTRPSRTGSARADVGSVGANVWVEYDVSALVTGQGTYSFALVSTSTDSVVMTSREGTSTNRPRLVLTVDDAATPTTAPSTAPTSTAATSTAATTSTGPTSSAPSTTTAPTITTAPATTSQPTTSAPATTTAAGIASVNATVETTPVPHSGDAADDPAIWANAADPARSAVVATDKLGGLLVYDMAGAQLQYLAVGQVNNVDVRPTSGTSGGLALSGRPAVLAVAGNRTDNSIEVYELDPSTRQLGDVAARVIRTGIAVYGSCLYRSPDSGKLFFFVNSKTGQVEQWELYDNGAGKVDGRLVRSFSVGGQVEGCVADDELGHLYIGQETVGIWKYGADPTAGTARTSVASTSATGPLVSNVEGLTIVRGSGGTGYLIASSQGNSTFVAYRREGGNAFVSAFRVAAGGGVDEVSGTDGIDANSAALGPAFPSGMLAVQDGSNDSGNQNFKYVPLERVFGN